MDSNRQQPVEEQKSEEELAAEDDEKWDPNEIPTELTEDLVKYKYRLMKRVLNLQQWQHVADKKNTKIKTYQCDWQDNFKGFKCVSEMDFSIPQLMGYLSNLEWMMDYNVPCEFARIV